MTKRKPISKGKTNPPSKAQNKSAARKVAERQNRPLEEWRRLYMSLEGDLRELVNMSRLGMDAWLKADHEDLEQMDDVGFAFGHLEKMIKAFHDKYHAEV
jgi:hypothetical protein